ncbi:hypothetical protein J4437_05400 [Candidatus Woesearchaeota archaeon]|nr:hypothetical protein [Candidatus Woesearchaeota archaeon]
MYINLIKQKKQKYSLEEKVEVCGWVSKDTGTIEDIKWIYHSRLGEYTWGYKVKLDNNKPVLNFSYIPEGYLRKLEQIKN